MMFIRTPHRLKNMCFRSILLYKKKYNIKCEKLIHENVRRDSIRRHQSALVCKTRVWPLHQRTYSRVNHFHHIHTCMHARCVDKQFVVIY